MKNQNKSGELCVISNPYFHNQILNKYLLSKRKGPFPDLILQNYGKFIKKYLKIFINFEIFNHLFLNFKNLLINTLGEYTIQYFVSQFATHWEFLRSKSKDIQKKENISVLGISKTEPLVMKKNLQNFKRVDQPFKYVSYVETKDRNVGSFWEIETQMGNKKVKYFYQYLSIKPINMLSKQSYFYLFRREKNMLKNLKYFVDGNDEPTRYSKKMFYRKTYNSGTKIEHIYVTHIQKFEEELKDIKKIISRTTKEFHKEVHSLRPIKEMIEKHINNHYDVNFLVDKVFDELKRKLRLERERRGF